jgi:hypothetical protein
MDFELNAVDNRINSREHEETEFILKMAEPFSMTSPYVNPIRYSHPSRMSMFMEPTPNADNLMDEENSGKDEVELLFSWNMVPSRNLSFSSR